MEVSGKARDLIFELIAAGVAELDETGCYLIIKDQDFMTKLRALSDDGEHPLHLVENQTGHRKI